MAEMAPNFLVEVRDRNFNRVGQISAKYLDVKYTEVFRGIGKWELKLPAEHPLLSALTTKGSGIVITETWTGGSRIYSGRTTSYQLDQDASDPDGTWTITGQDDGVLAKATVVYPDPANAANAQTTAYWNYAGNGETVMKQAVLLNAGASALAARKYSWLTVAASLNRGATASASARFDVLGDLLQATAATAGLGWRFYQVGAGVTFDVTVPQDKSALIRLDIRNGGLDSTELATTAPSATTAYVLGQGEGVDRTVLAVTSSAATADAALWGLKWETTKDQRNTDDPTALTNAGNEIVADAGITGHSLKVSPSGAPGQRLGIDWGLGDTVTVIIDNQETKAVVTQTATAIGSAGVIKQATVGDPVGFDWDAKVSSAITSHAQRIDRLENYVDAAPPSPTTRATVTGVTSTGFPSLVDSAGTTLTVLGYAKDYIPTPGDTVFLTQPNAWVPEYYVTGADRGYIELAMDPTYSKSYNLTYGEDYWAFPRAYKRNGFVALSGLLSLTGSIAVGSVLATLPVGYRPDTRMMFNVNNSDIIRAIDVLANGQIQVRAGSTAGGYLSLDSIVFPVAGRAAWTDITTFGSGFAQHSDTAYGNVRYWRDEYGFTWLAGLVATTAVNADNAKMFSLPAGYGGSLEIHIVTTAANTLGGLHTGLAARRDDVNVKIPVPGSGTWISLGGCVIVTATALADTRTVWQKIGTDIPIQNGWAQYPLSTTYQNLAVGTRADGLNFTTGLARAGTGLGSSFSNRMFILPENTRSVRSRIHPVLAEGGNGRIDLTGRMGGLIQGGFSPVNGSTVWYSIDGPKWISDNY